MEAASDGGRWSVAVLGGREGGSLAERERERERELLEMEFGCAIWWVNGDIERFYSVF